MTKYLLDANLSPETAVFLREALRLDVVHQRDVLPGSPTDEDIVELAKLERRVVITFDTDFGEIYHLRERGKFGVIQLELRDQTVEAVNRVLFNLLSPRGPVIDFSTALVTVEQHRIRVVEPEVP